MQQIYALWINQICGTAGSEKRYKEDIVNFENWARSKHNLETSDIPKKWREAKYSDKQAEKERFLDDLKDVVSDYFVYLKKYGYTSMSVNRAMATLMSFLHYFDIPIKSIRIKHPFVQYHNRDITKEEIKLILSNSGVRNRAVYLILYETGMRPWTCVNLRWKHIKEDFLAQKVPMKIKLTSDIMKCGVSERFVFIGQEGFEALNLYIKRRGVPMNDDDLIFVTEKPFGKAIGTTGLSQAFNVIVQRLKLAEPRGLATKDGRRNKPKELRLYTLRKAFSKFMAVNVDRTLVEFWLGHTSTATHYVSEDVEFHRAQYAKGYPGLRLETTTATEDALEDLRRENLELKVQMSKMNEEYKKHEDLADKVRRLEEMFGEGFQKIDLKNKKPSD